MSLCKIHLRKYLYKSKILEYNILVAFTSLPIQQLKSQMKAFSCFISLLPCQITLHDGWLCLLKVTLIGQGHSQCLGPWAISVKLLLWHIQ